MVKDRGLDRSTVTDSPPRNTGMARRVYRNIVVERELYILILPGIVYFVIFHYIPMYGVQIAFRDYLPGMESMFTAEWIGLQNFRRFFDSYRFWTVVRNTLTISLMDLFLGFPGPIILAIMLNELSRMRLKKMLQTLSYAPHFISVVGMAGMVLVFLSGNGLVNSFISLVGGTRRMWMAEQAFFPWIYVLSIIWKSTGFGSIIFIAALSAVDQELYEAARVDGATKLQKILHIDIPSIMPTMVILLILRCGRIMTVGFEYILLLQNPLNISTSEVISTFVYKVGIASAAADFGYGTAIGLFNSVINLVLLVSVNYIARRISDKSLW
jgi:putative aldouronate transport system permease protein